MKEMKIYSGGMSEKLKKIEVSYKLPLQFYKKPFKMNKYMEGQAGCPERRKQ